MRGSGGEKVEVVVKGLALSYSWSGSLLPSVQDTKAPSSLPSMPPSLEPGRVATSPCRHGLEEKHLARGTHLQ